MLERNRDADLRYLGADLYPNVESCSDSATSVAACLARVASLNADID